MADTINVLITLPLPEQLVAKVRNVSPRLKVTVMKARKVEDIPEDQWRTVEVLYTNQVLPEPEKAPKLRWIQFHWAGVEQVVDAPILHKPEVVATTLSGAAASQIAEYILMMLLALGHHLPELIANQRRSEWPKDRWERFAPRELRGSTVGIIGYGSIGRQVARLLHEFGTQILATKRDVMRPEDRGYMPPDMGDPEASYVRRLYPPEALHAMLRECDFVIVTVPFTPQTRHLIGSEELAVLKSSAYLVDVSRGGVINHSALIPALRDHRIAGAALDVFPEEPLPADSPLWKMPNVIITPHISGVTAHYDERAVELFIENLERYLSEQPLYNRIVPERGY